MRMLSSALVAAVGLSQHALAEPVPLAIPHSNPLPRALSNAPNAYAPKAGPCPSGSLVRSASDLSDGEQAFLKTRKASTDKALNEFLSRTMTDFDVDSFLSDYSPTVSIAFSGGGYRAMLAGAGVLKAMDSRTANTTSDGQIGGLLQSATYIAGLSGGSWLLGSVYLNNFTTIQDLQDSGDVWDLTYNILEPEGAIHILDTARYYNDIHDEVSSKEDAGFDVTITDYWGRALSRQFLDYEDGGPGVTWSSIALGDAFAKAEFPFPIVVADERNPGEVIVADNSTVFEFNPLEFGSFDKSLYSFTNLTYIGTNVSDGRPTDDKACIRGFDNGGFVMGTSSSLFNQIILSLPSSGAPELLQSFAEGVLGEFSEAEADIADYTPNPFFGINPDTFASADTRNLTLVDGGEDLQNLPLNPLYQPQRKVDVIFASDNSADTLLADGTTTNFPNGTAMVATYERSLNKEVANGSFFPAIPDTNTFINLGLNNRPTFFGCDGSNITSDPDKYPPLIVYLPNSPWSYFSNTSTYKMSYETQERDAIIANSMDMATQGNNTDWAGCVACAIVHRHVERTGGAQTAQCKKCMTDYCWNGTLDANEVVYNPEAKVAGITSGAAAIESGVGMFVAVVVSLFVLGV